MINPFAVESYVIPIAAHVVALPAAGAGTTTPALALDQTSGHKFTLEVSVPALPSLADGKALTVNMEDSADGQSWADLAAFPSVTITGASTAGGVPVVFSSRVPATASTNARIKFSIAADGGDSTAVEALVRWAFVPPA
jgi:hypothetical protein